MFKQKKRKEYDTIALRQKLKSLDNFIRYLDKDIKMQFITFLTPIFTLLALIVSVNSPIITQLLYYIINVYNGNPDKFVNKPEYLIYAIFSIVIIIVFYYFIFIKYYLLSRSYTYRNIQYAVSKIENKLGISKILPISWDNYKNVKIKKRIFSKYELCKFLPECIRIYFILINAIELFTYFILFFISYRLTKNLNNCFFIVILIIAFFSLFLVFQ